MLKNPVSLQPVLFSPCSSPYQLLGEALLALMKKVFLSVRQSCVAFSMPGISYKYCWASEAEIYPSTESTFGNAKSCWSVVISLPWPRSSELALERNVSSGGHSPDESCYL